jgi:hypothetical protein
LQITTQSIEYDIKYLMYITSVLIVGREFSSRLRITFYLLSCRLTLGRHTLLFLVFLTFVRRQSFPLTWFSVLCTQHQMRVIYTTFFPDRCVCSC